MTRGSDWRKPDTLIVCLLVAGVSLFHIRGLWPGQVFLPLDVVNNDVPWRAGPFGGAKLQNPVIADPIYQYYPDVAQVVRELQQGRWLLWDSHMLVGQPSFGDPAYQTFYPVFTLLGLLLGLARGLTIGYWLHAALAAVFTYGWLHEQDYPRPAAALGAFAYAVGGTMVTWLETPFFVGTLAWLPGVLWMLEAALRRRNLACVAAGALMFGLAVLAGQISFVVIFSLFLGAYALGRVIEFSRARQVFVWPLAGSILILGLGGLLAMLHLLPFAEVLGQSNRAGGVAFTAFPWQQLVTLLVPDFYGNPATAYAYWGVDNYSESTFYAGLVVLFLALAALLGSRRFWSLYIGLLGIGLVFFSCGGLGQTWSTQLPVIQYVSLNRSMFLLPLILALLAAEALRLQPLRWGAPVAAALIIAAVVSGAVYVNRADLAPHLKYLSPLVVRAAGVLGGAGALLAARERWPRLRDLFTWALVGVAFADLYVWGAGYNPALPLRSFPTATPGIQYLQQHDDGYRVLTRQDSGEFIFGLNFLSTFGVSDLTFYSPVLPASVRKLITAGDPGSLGYHRAVIVYGRPSLRLADLLQAGYIVTRNPLDDPGVRAEQALGDCSSQTGEIRRDHPAEGQFVVQHFAINRLDVAARVDQANAPDANLTIRLWQGQARDRLVLEQSFTRSQLEGSQIQTFYFAPETTALGQTYVWEISTDAPATGVRLCAGAGGSADLGIYGVDWVPVYQGEFAIAQRTIPLPRAYVVYAAEVISDETQAVARLLDDNFDVRNVAITPGPVLPAATAGVPKATPAQIQVYENQRVVIRAEAAQPGLLVLGDYYYPEWDVWVDGRPAALVRANLIWRGVQLSPGQHTVEFRFFPRSLKFGLGLSGLGLLGLLGLLLAQRRRATQR